MCKALRDLNDSHIELRNDFILMQGDIISNANLKPAIELHFKKKSNKDFETFLTKVFAELPFSSSLRDPNLEVTLLLDA